MAKKSAALIAAEAKIAALEARLVVARDVYREQKARIVELEASCLAVSRRLKSAWPLSRLPRD